MGKNGQDTSLRNVRSWTIDGSTACVYTAEAGWKFRADPDQGDQLRTLLAGIFGPPLLLARRGSRRARIAAATVAVLGLAVAAAGIAQDIPAFAMVGVPAFVLGLALLGALSQKVRSARYQ